MNPHDSAAISQFTRWAHFYDQILHPHFARVNRRVAHELNPHDHQQILDIGCGSAILLQQLHSRFPTLKLYGIDITAAMTRLARAKCAHHPSTLIAQASAQALPFADASFDALCCCTSFHHYPDPQGALQEMLRVLKPGGQCVLLDPFVDGMARKALCTALNTLCGEKNVQLFTKDQLYTLFRKAGFINILQRPFGYYRLISTAIKPLYRL